VLKSGIHFPTLLLSSQELNIAANSTKDTYVRAQILRQQISENDELGRGEALTLCAPSTKSNYTTASSPEQVQQLRTIVPLLKLSLRHFASRWTCRVCG
jgi:hypothetical protein